MGHVQLTKRVKTIGWDPVRIVSPNFIFVVNIIFYINIIFFNNIIFFINIIFFMSPISNSFISVIFFVIEIFLNYTSSNQRLLSVEEFNGLSSIVSSRDPDSIANVMWGIKPIQSAVKHLSLAEVKANCCSLQRCSILRKCDFSDHSNFNWRDILQEMDKQCPFLLDVLVTTASDDSHVFEDAKVPVICMVYGMLLYQRSCRIGRLQQLFTILLSRSAAKKEIYREFQRVGVCQSFTQKDVLLNKIGGHFNEEAMELVKKGSKFQIIGDNFDLRVLRHDMTKDAKNIDLHYFASTIVFDRISFEQLPDDKPTRPLQQCPISSFVPNEDEINTLKKSYKILVARDIVECCPALAFMKSVIPHHIKHKYSDITKEKSALFTQEILPCNENNYGEVVQILSRYEEWVHNIFRKESATPLVEKQTEVSVNKLDACFESKILLSHTNGIITGHGDGDADFCMLGADELTFHDHVHTKDLQDEGVGICSGTDNYVLQETGAKSDTPASCPNVQSRPDQPGSHMMQVDPADPLQHVHIPVGGDQLTRVRLAGAKDLRAGVHTARQRFDHLYPFICEIWHAKKAFLNVRFGLCIFLYFPKSTHDNKICSLPDLVLEVF
ncbi:uncharacterized protein LOC119733822 [Patiria miniata]|uniref:DUF6589 domain-containing protein n=1 Tax=Patiria miniata TaxID=46514 RepID=A0A914AGK8_PATMI|nr:uncharacterized protein LOC119733822 [Patiria miniata]